MRGATLSVALIARDEELVLERILRDARSFSDEVIVVDTGSSDGTPEVARRCGAHVYRHEWNDDFAAARNFAFDKCASEWVMWLDADDRVPRCTQQYLARTKARLSKRANVEIVYMPYRFEYVGDDAGAFNGCINRVRIVRRDSGFRWVGRIHETLNVAEAPALWLDNIWIEHRPLEEVATKKRERDRRILEASIRAGDRSPSVLLHYGILLTTLHELDAAGSIFEECLIISDSGSLRYTALRMAAVCAGELGDLGRCASYLYEALDLDSRRAEAFVDLGVAHELRGDYAGAMPFFRAAIGLSAPRDVNYSAPAYSWAPLVGMARCAWRLGRQSEARRWLEEATFAAPHLVEAFRRLTADLESGLMLNGNRHGSQTGKDPGRMKATPFEQVLSEIPSTRSTDDTDAPTVASQRSL